MAEHATNAEPLSYTLPEPDAWILQWEHPCLEFSQFCKEVKETSFGGGWVVVVSNDAEDV